MEKRPSIRNLARELAIEAGFSEAGMVALPVAGAAREAARFEEFVSAGFAGEMSWLERRGEDGELVRGDAMRPFGWARSVVVCLASYNSGAVRSVESAPEGAGWIARYAVTGRESEGRVAPSDYHKVLLRRLRRVESGLKAEFGEFESRAYVDTGPLMERPLAVAAGLGWVGKNTCLIHQKLGSFVFLAVLVTALEIDGAVVVNPDRCGSCTRCLEACPTDALIGSHKLDARRCISYLTIEHEGEIDAELERGIGRNVFGCDICQDVCPWNRKPAIVRDSELMERGELVNPSLEWLAAMSEQEFERVFNGSPVRRAGYAGFRRNVERAIRNVREHAG
jgi:epoxyqueuosine reductase